jgi:hypothetical protein
MKITVATMDRAIWAARLGVGLDCHDPALRDRAIYLRGLEDAAKVEDESYHAIVDREEQSYQSCFDAGHSAKTRAIRETAKRLRKEIKG